MSMVDYRMSIHLAAKARREKWAPKPCVVIQLPKGRRAYDAPIGPKKPLYEAKVVKAPILHPWKKTARRIYKYAIGPKKPSPCVTARYRDPSQVLPGLTAHEIVLRTCWFYGVDPVRFAARDKLQDIVLARHVAWYICCQLTSLTTVQIGKYTGGFDHATVLHGAQRVQHLISINQLIASDVESLKGFLRELNLTGEP